MRFMVIVKGNEQSEAGELPPPELFEEMHAFNEELAKNGIMLAGEGLKPSSQGVRIDFNGSKPKVIDGPFTEAKELVAGFWLIQARSLEEAVEWFKRAPFGGGELEIRPIHEPEDLIDAAGSELVEKEARLREQLAQNK
ncbi:MAG: YciI family protein [Actinomycetota bacterium]